MIRKLFFLFSIAFIYKINCVKLNDIKLTDIQVYLDDSADPVETADYLEIDNDEESCNGIQIVKNKEVSLVKIVFNCKDHTEKTVYGSIVKFEEYLKSQDLSNIKFYLKSYNQCFKKITLLINNKHNTFMCIPYEFIIYIYDNLNKCIKKEDINVNIFTFNCTEEYLFNNGSLVESKTGMKLGLFPNLFNNNYCFFIKDILIGKKRESIITRGDTVESIKNRISGLKKEDIYFKIEYKECLSETVNFHINFDNFKSKYEYLESVFKADFKKGYFDEYFCKKKIKRNSKAVTEYKPLYNYLPFDLKIKNTEPIYKKADLINKIKESFMCFIKNYQLELNNNFVYYLFDDNKIKLYKKYQYLTENERKIEYGEEEDINFENFFVEFDVEDILKFYSVKMSYQNVPQLLISVKIETADEKFDGDRLEFCNNFLLSDYLKENIFCKKGFSFIKDIKKYKVIYNGNEYEPGQHIVFDHKKCKEVIFKILESDDDIAKKKKAEEDRKKALIGALKKDLENLKNSITDKMSSVELRNKLNSINNVNLIDDVECKKLKNEIESKINEKIQNELKSTNNEAHKHNLMNDSLKDLLKKSNFKNSTELQASLNSLLPNDYQPNDENNKLINEIKNIIKTKKIEEKDRKKDQGDPVDDNNDVSDEVITDVKNEKGKKCCTSCRYKKK